MGESREYPIDMSFLDDDYLLVCVIENAGSQ